MTPDLSRMARAAHFAAEAHAPQRRKGGDVPYINHPLEVAAMVAAAGAGEPAVAAALLHDVIEDTEATREALARAFGADAARIAAELTDHPDWETLPLAERKARQAEHAPHLSGTAKRVKIADQTANLLDRRAQPHLWRPEALQDYLTGARAIFEGVRGADPVLETQFEVAALDLAEAIAHRRGPRPRGLDGPPRTAGLPEAEAMRAGFAEAALYAARRHAAQRRKGARGEPYINHVLEVTARLAAAHPEDLPALAAALLHDVVEDTEASHEEVQARFGRDIGAIVAEVSDDKSLPKQERKRLQVLHAPGKSERARRLKLADLAANVASLVSDPPADWSWERRRAYLDWARRVADGCRSADVALAEAFDAEAARLERKLGDWREAPGPGPQ